MSNSDEKKSTLRIPIRFTHGTAKLVQIPGVLPREKRQKEIRLCEILAFAGQRIGNLITEIKTNENDADGGPDVLCNFNGVPAGIQVTEFINERSRSSVAVEKAMAAQMAIALTRQLPITNDQKYVFSFYCQDNTSNPRLNEKEIDQIVTEIKSQFTRDTDLAVIALNGKQFRDVIITKLKEGESSNLPGNENFFIKFDFADTFQTPTAPLACFHEILKKKSNSKAKILLIWGKDRLWMEHDSIIQELKQASLNSTGSIELILFMTFLNNSEIFHANPPKVTVLYPIQNGST